MVAISLTAVFNFVLFQVVCDLNEICKLHLPPEINLVKEVEKLCRICPSDNTEQSNAKEKRSEQQKDKMKRPFSKYWFNVHNK